MARLALVSSSPAVPFGGHGAVGAGPKWSSRPSSRPSPMAGAATCRELTGHSFPAPALALAPQASTGTRAAAGAPGALGAAPRLRVGWAQVDFPPLLPTQPDGLRAHMPGAHRPFQPDPLVDPTRTVALAPAIGRARGTRCPGALGAAPRLGWAQT